ncbi:MAG: phage tail protein [Spirochaetia bacterium]|nr:phage tail protein [Spirochaetia bacterium]
MKEVRTRIVDSVKSGFFKGVGLGAGLLTTGLFAAAAAMNVFAPGQTISSAQINQNFAIAAPEGAIMAFNLANCPDGWAPADGSNGTPDMRGKFVRGRNDIGTGSPASAFERDPDARTLGSFQGDAFQGHTFNFGFVGGGVLPGFTTGWLVSDVGSGSYTTGAPTTGANGVPRVANETRSMNIALTYCMRKN